MDLNYSPICSVLFKLSERPRGVVAADRPGSGHMGRSTFMAEKSLIFLKLCYWYLSLRNHQF